MKYTVHSYIIKSYYNDKYGIETFMDVNIIMIIEVLNSGSHDCCKHVSKIKIILGTMRHTYYYKNFL